MELSMIWSSSWQMVRSVFSGSLRWVGALLGGVLAWGMLVALYYPYFASLVLFHTVAFAQLMVLNYGSALFFFLALPWGWVVLYVVVALFVQDRLCHTGCHWIALWQRAVREACRVCPMVWWYVGVLWLLAYVVGTSRHYMGWYGTPSSVVHWGGLMLGVSLALRARWSRGVAWLGRLLGYAPERSLVGQRVGMYWFFGGLWAPLCLVALYGIVVGVPVEGLYAVFLVRLMVVLLVHGAFAFLGAVHAYAAVQLAREGKVSSP